MSERMQLVCLWLIIMLFLLCMSPSCEAADKWTPEQKVMQGLYLTARVIDWGQTRYVSDHNKYHEKNIILGENPSLKSINNFFFISTLIQATVVHVLPSKYRTTVLAVLVISQVRTIIKNNSIGVRIRF